MKLTHISDSTEYPGKQELRFADGRVLISSPEVSDEFLLYPGKELTEEDVEAIKAAFSIAETRKQALRAVERRAMSKKELQDRLVRKGQRQEDAQAAADWLEEMGILNDEEYAAMVVRHYGERGYGPLRIQQELGKRGIDRHMWQQALTELPDQSGAVDQFLQRKLGGEPPDRREQKRVTDALYRRGFSWEEISAGLRRYERLVDEKDSGSYG